MADQAEQAQTARAEAEALIAAGWPPYDGRRRPVIVYAYIGDECWYQIITGSGARQMFWADKQTWLDVLYDGFQQAGTRLIYRGELLVHPAITCLVCGITSHHPGDVAQRWCTRCKRELGPGEAYISGA